MIYGNIFLEKFDIKEFINKKKEEKARKAEEKRLESLSWNESGYPIRFIKEHPKINQKFLDDLFDLPRELAGVALIYGKYNDSDIIKFIQSNCGDASKIVAKDLGKKHENNIINKLGANNIKNVKFATATDDNYIFFYNNKFLIYEYSRYDNKIYSEITTLQKMRSLGNKDIKEYEQDYKDVAEYLGVKI